MGSGSWIAKRGALIACAIGAVACDLVAEPGQLLVLGDRGAAFGSGGNAQTAPLPAVRVQPGGALIVQDADVFGGGILVEQQGQQRFQSAGAGIFSGANSAILIQQGLVAGGPVVLRVPETALDNTGPGVRAVGSAVEVSGGTIRGGALVSEVGTLPPSLPAAAIEIDGGTLRVTGGTFMAGARVPPDPILDSLRFSVRAQGSVLEIRGGTFSDGFGTIDSRTRIFGGAFEFLVIQSSTPSGCSELRGGLLSGLGVDRGRVIVAGTGLSLAPADPGASRLTGTLENGQPVNARVVQRNGGIVQLVSSGAPGCP